MSYVVSKPIGIMLLTRSWSRTPVKQQMDGKDHIRRFAAPPLGEHAASIIGQKAVGLA